MIGGPQKAPAQMSSKSPSQLHRTWTCRGIWAPQSLHCSVPCKVNTQRGACCYKTGWHLSWDEKVHFSHPGPVPSSTKPQHLGLPTDVHGCQRRPATTATCIFSCCSGSETTLLIFCGIDLSIHCMVTLAPMNNHKIKKG